jgi:hypothetical protein
VNSNDGECMITPRFTHFSLRNNVSFDVLQNFVQSRLAIYRNNAENDFRDSFLISIQRAICISSMVILDAIQIAAPHCALPPTRPALDDSKLSSCCFCVGAADQDLSMRVRWTRSRRPPFWSCTSNASIAEGSEIHRA